MFPLIILIIIIIIIIIIITGRSLDSEEFARFAKNDSHPSMPP